MFGSLVTPLHPDGVPWPQKGPVPGTTCILILAWVPHLVRIEDPSPMELFFLFFFSLRSNIISSYIAISDVTTTCSSSNFSPFPSTLPRRGGFCHNLWPV